MVSYQKMMVLRLREFELQCLSCICRRRLKCEIASTYCTLTWEQVDSLIPDAKLVFIICLATVVSP